MDAESPDSTRIESAAKALRRGELVAFPTETVYGLGANALDAEAVARIYEAKDRPAFNPIIVHVADTAAARTLVTEWPEAAVSLAERFWPGPLTLVLPKRDSIPNLVTAGGSTVGIRVPAHPVALALLRAVGVPIAAPSANCSTAVSPTTAAHVLKGLDGRIAMVIDGGPTSGGIESTVLDLSVSPPRLLRPGLISRDQIELIIGLTGRTMIDSADGSPVPSPGLMRRHYAPRAKVELIEGHEFERALELQVRDNKNGWMPIDAEIETDNQSLFIKSMPGDPQRYAAQLYSTLHTLDEAGVDRIVIQLPPNTPEWLAVRDRLRRAASEN